MWLAKKIFQSVDDLYYFQAPYKSGSSFWEEDRCPGEVYKDMIYTGVDNLKNGFHCAAVDRADVEKYGYHPLLFDSPVVTPWTENNLVPFRWFRNTGKRSNVLLLFSPGWARPNLRLEKEFCARLMRGGIDAGLLCVPYHQERAPRGSYSGEYFISPHLYLTIENFRQYVAEIRLLIQYMRKQYDYVGIIGMSSGGFQAGLAITAEPVHFYFPLITGAKLGSILWESKITGSIKRVLIDRGIGKCDANRIWAVADLLYVGCHTKAMHIKQYISLYDQVVPTRYQYMLWEVYGRPEKMELECAHVSVAFFMNKIADDMIEYVKCKTSI
ncbi:MAG: hypothetical protein JST68_04470 [Bacteroidetes bacterium]|nr:hypothetical protein [Bacteroidota bacterium]